MSCFEGIVEARAGAGLPKDAMGEWKVDVGEAERLRALARFALSCSPEAMSRAEDMVCVVVEVMGLGGEVSLMEMEVVVKSAGVGGGAAVLLSGSMTTDGM